VGLPQLHCEQLDARKVPEVSIGNFPPIIAPPFKRVRMARRGSPFGAIWGDVVRLWRVGRLYERGTGVKPRLALVTPFPTGRALEAARRLGVEICTSV